MTDAGNEFVMSSATMPPSWDVYESGGHKIVQCSFVFSMMPRNVTLMELIFAVGVILRLLAAKR